MNHTWQEIKKIKERSKSKGSSISNRIDELSGRAEALLTNRSEQELIHLSEVSEGLDSIFKRHNKNNENTLTPLDLYKCITIADLPKTYAALNPKPQEILCIFSLGCIGSAISFIELHEATKRISFSDKKIEILLNFRQKEEPNKQPDKLIKTMDALQDELSHSAYSLLEGAIGFLFLASDFLVLAEQISGNPLSKYTPDEYAKVVSSIKATMAVNARHSRVQGTKDNFIKFYQKAKSNNKEITKTSAAIKFYNSLSPEDQSKLAPSRIEANGTRTLLAALKKHEKSSQKE